MIRAKILREHRVVSGKVGDEIDFDVEDARVLVSARIVEALEPLPDPEPVARSVEEPKKAAKKKKVAKKKK